MTWWSSRPSTQEYEEIVEEYEEEILMLEEF
jgi:hypothetical protein